MKKFEKIKSQVVRIIFIVLMSAIMLFFIFGVVEYFFGRYYCAKQNSIWIDNPPLFGKSQLQNRIETRIYEKYNVQKKYSFGFCVTEK